MEGKVKAKEANKDIDNSKLATGHATSRYLKEKYDLIVSPVTLRKWAEDGRIQHYKSDLYCRGALRFNPEEVKDALWRQITANTAKTSSSSSVTFEPSSTTETIATGAATATGETIVDRSPEAKDFMQRLLTEDII